MSLKLNKILSISACFITLYAPTLALSINCPTLTATEVNTIIFKGTISTNQGYTLAHEAHLTPAEVLQNEPTANPFDTYYTMHTPKKIDQKEYLILIGNVLGKDPHEAKYRAKKIIVGSETLFQGKEEDSLCVYKTVEGTDVSAPLFKTHFESLILVAVPAEEANLSHLKTLHFWKN